MECSIETLTTGLPPGQTYSVYVITCRSRGLAVESIVYSVYRNIPVFDRFAICSKSMNNKSTQNPSKKEEKMTGPRWSATVGIAYTKYILPMTTPELISAKVILPVYGIPLPASEHLVKPPASVLRDRGTRARPTHEAKIFFGASVHSCQS